MAKRTSTHFKVGAGLFNDITQILFTLPALTSRDVLNRIETAECEPIFKVELGRPAMKRPARKKARKKVARKKRRD